MQQEFQALLANDTWKLILPPKGAKIIENKWVFTIKLKAYGSLERYINRLVAKGYDQTHVIDYIETFNPMVKPTTISVVLTLTLSKNWVSR